MHVSQTYLEYGANEVQWWKGVRLMGVHQGAGYSDAVTLVVLIPDGELKEYTTRYFNVVSFMRPFPESPNDNPERTWQYIGTTCKGVTVFEDVAVPDPLQHIWTCGAAGTIYHGAVAAKTLDDACMILAERDKRFGGGYDVVGGTWKELQVCGGRDAAVAWWAKQPKDEQGDHGHTHPHG